MKPFNLEKALAGEPVILRDGTKATVYANISHLGNVQYPLKGVIYSEKEGRYLLYSTYNWTLEGSYVNENDKDDLDIIGMWEELIPRVQLDLPCPLKKWRRNCYTITNDLSVKKTVHTERPFDENLHFYFATEKDAQEWINAMRNSRR